MKYIVSTTLFDIFEKRSNPSPAITKADMTSTIYMSHSDKEDCD
jgi:hypothetical protein